MIPTTTNTFWSIQAGNNLKLTQFVHVSDVGDNKTDVNNGGGLGTDMVGGAWDYPEANYSRRQEIFNAHKVMHMSVRLMVIFAS